MTSEEFGIPGSPDSYNAKTSGICGSAYIGGKYYFNAHLAAMAEVGYGTAFLNLGIAIRLK